jgi:hypothetical protein
MDYLGLKSLAPFPRDTLETDASRLREFRPVTRSIHTYTMANLSVIWRMSVFFLYARIQYFKRGPILLGQSITLDLLRNVDDDVK